MSEERCETCRYWQPTEVRFRREPPRRLEGVCKRFPHNVSPYADDWCGEWRARVEPAHAPEPETPAEPVLSAEEIKRHQTRMEAYLGRTTGMLGPTDLVHLPVGFTRRALGQAARVPALLEEVDGLKLLRGQNKRLLEEVRGYSDLKMQHEGLKEEVARLKAELKQERSAHRDLAMKEQRRSNERFAQIDALNAEIARLKEEKPELPERRLWWVVNAREDRETCCARWVGDSHWINLRVTHWMVTHWMPADVPEPPKEDS